jgi:hypothetical protein
VITFIELLQPVTSSKYYAITVLHTSQNTVRHSRSHHLVTVFTSRCLVAAFNNGRSPSSEIRNSPPPQLPASHKNSLEQMQTSGYLINSNTYLVLLGNIGLHTVIYFGRWKNILPARVVRSRQFYSCCTLVTST